MIEKLFMLEDKVLKQPGLYGMWSILYLANLITLCSDSIQGPVRDFNIFTTLLSHIYTSVSGVNVIYGNKKPSSLLMIAGPLHQYAFWMLLAYYRGNVYGSSPIGIINVIHTVVVAIFTIDMVIKTWLLSINPSLYLEYLNHENVIDEIQNVENDNEMQVMEMKQDADVNNDQQEEESVIKQVSENLVKDVVNEVVSEV